MCAIAALASCSQNEDTPAGSEAAGARVTLHLEGDGTGTRAAGNSENATEAGAAIANATVFFFNQTDFIVGSPKYLTADQLNQAIQTTTDSKKVVVLANVGDHTTGVFKNVSSLEQLKKVDFSSIAGDPKTVNQSKDNLYSSGMGDITLDTKDNTGTATVQMHFVAAKIKGVKIAWKDNQNYAENATEFQGQKDKWFYIKKVYMMTTQTNSPLLPSGATGTAWNGDFIPQTYAFAGGVAWGQAPWEWTDAAITQPIQTNDYLVTPMPASANNSINNVLAADKSWYLFENNSLSTHLTGLIVEVVWRSKTESMNANEYLTKYFTVYFGEQSGANAQPLLKAGSVYTMALNLNGDFKPGGNAGGGGDTPATPTVDASVTVTVTPAAWNTTAEISKEFQ